METLNRRQRRTLKRLIKSSKPIENAFQDGDKVRINANKIMSRKEWSNGSLQRQYRDFVENNRGTIFTVRRYRDSHMCELVEEPRWLFVFDDLIKV